MDLYTDWWCSKNPWWYGAYAYYCQWLDISGSGFRNSTTNNRMELMGIYCWLLAVLESWYIWPLTVYSDSQYAINTAQWKWKAKMNRELVNSIMRLIDDMAYNTITFEWVKWHSGNTWNEIVDEMCTHTMNQLA